MFETELRRRFDELAARSARQGKSFVVPADASGPEVTVGYQAPAKNTPEALHFSASAPHAPPPLGTGYRASASPEPLTLCPATLRDENGFDRLGKRVGLNVEARTGDPEFDTGAYIESWSPAPALERLLADPELLSELKRARLDGFHPITLGGYRGSVSLQATRPAPLDLDAFVARGVAQARRLAALTRHVRPAGSRAGHAILGGVALAAWMLASLFAAERVRLAFPTIESWMDQLTGKLLLLLVGLVGVGLVWRLARGRSISATVFVVCAPLVTVALPATLLSTLRGLNGALDGSPAEHRLVPLLGTWSFKPSKGSRSYHAKVGSWREPARTLELLVTLEQHTVLAKPGAKQVEVVTKRGALGAEWLVALTPR